MNSFITDFEEQQSKLRTWRIGSLGRGWGESVALSCQANRDSVKWSRSEDLKALSKRSLGREEELNRFITDLEEQHSKLKH